MKRPGICAALRDALQTQPDGMTRDELLQVVSWPPRHRTTAMLASLIAQGQVGREGDRYRLLRGPLRVNRREEVLDLLYIGKDAATIAEIMGLNIGWIYKYVKDLKDEYGAATDAGLVYQALRAGRLVPPEVRAP